MPQAPSARAYLGACGTFPSSTAPLGAVHGKAPVGASYGGLWWRDVVYAAISPSAARSCDSRALRTGSIGVARSFCRSRSSCNASAITCR